MMRWHGCLAALFGLRLQFILLFNPQVKSFILHLLLSNETKSKGYGHSTVQCAFGAC